MSCANTGSQTWLLATSSQLNPFSSVRLRDSESSRHNVNSRRLRRPDKADKVFPQINKVSPAPGVATAPCLNKSLLGISGSHLSLSERHVKLRQSGETRIMSDKLLRTVSKRWLSHVFQNLTPSFRLPSGWVERSESLIHLLPVNLFTCGMLQTGAFFSSGFRNRLSRPGPTCLKMLTLRINVFEKEKIKFDEVIH